MNNNEEKYLLLSNFLNKPLENNVPYTIIDNSIDFIHYGYYDVDKRLNIYDAQLNLILFLMNNIDIKKGEVILDVGCGVGGFLNYLNKKYSNITLVGVDINYTHISLARKKNISLNNNTIMFYNTDINLFYSQLKFDKIFAIECGFHFNKKNFLEKSLHFLNKNGIIILSDIVTTNKIKLLKNKPAINKIIEESFGNFWDFWKPFDYLSTMKQLNFTILNTKDISNETYNSYSFLKQYANSKTLKGIKLLEILHKNKFIKYITVVARL
jgi:cyclopropane fatty-acyl-phospholipid synthase-like methyltransferase